MSLLYPPTTEGTAGDKLRCSALCPRGPGECGRGPGECGRGPGECGRALENVGGARFDWCIAELFSAREYAGGLQSQNYIIVIINIPKRMCAFLQIPKLFQTEISNIIV